MCPTGPWAAAQNIMRCTNERRNSTSTFHKKIPPSPHTPPRRPKNKGQMLLCPFLRSHGSPSPHVGHGDRHGLPGLCLRNTDVRGDQRSPSDSRGVAVDRGARGGNREGKERKRRMMEHDLVHVRAQPSVLRERGAVYIQCACGEMTHQRINTYVGNTRVDRSTSQVFSGTTSVGVSWT